MAYYIMYHAVMALFFRTGIKCENHSATILLLKEVFSIDNTPLSDAKRERIDKEHYVDTAASGKDVENLIQKTELFNAHLQNFIERITNEKITKLRERLRLISNKAVDVFKLRTLLTRSTLLHIVLVAVSYTSSDAQ